LWPEKAKKSQSKQPLELRHEQLARFVHRRDTQHGAAILANHLPWDDVGVVLHGGDENLVARLDESLAVTVCDQVDGLGGSANEDDFALICCAEEPLHLHARGLVGRGRARAEQMHGAVHVGVVGHVVFTQGLKHGARLLSSRGVVEINERLSMHLLVEDGEVESHRTATGFIGAPLLRFPQDARAVLRPGIRE
jgi:hypothetical protein